VPTDSFPTLVGVCSVSAMARSKDAPASSQKPPNKAADSSQKAADSSQKPCNKAADSPNAEVPAKKPRVEFVTSDPKPVETKSDSKQVLVAKPVLPTAATADVEATIRSVIPYVQQQLRVCLSSKEAAFAQFPDQALHLHAPLMIKESANRDELVSFKAPWTTTDALASLSSTAMYEAGCNLLWCNPFPASQDAMVIAGDRVLWDHVREAAEVHFSALAAPQGRAISRLVFPISLPIHVDDDKVIQGGIFPSVLPLVSGHVYVYAWWVAMFKALDAGSMSDVAALWQCALIVTVTVRMGMSQADLAIFSIQQSELRKHVAAH